MITKVAVLKGFEIFFRETGTFLGKQCCRN